MASIFGIEERDSQGFLEKGTVCISHTSGDRSGSHSAFYSIKNSDIVFIKQFHPQSGLRIEAVGIVRSAFITQGETDICLPVEWVWRGKVILQNFDENPALRGESLYEEHDILVQKEIISLLPERCQVPHKW